MDYVLTSVAVCLKYTLALRKIRINLPVSYIEEILSYSRKNRYNSGDKNGRGGRGNQGRGNQGRNEGRGRRR